MLLTNSDQVIKLKYVDTKRTIIKLSGPDIIYYKLSLITSQTRSFSLVMESTKNVDSFSLDDEDLSIDTLLTLKLILIHLVED